MDAVLEERFGFGFRLLRFVQKDADLYAEPLCPRSDAVQAICVFDLEAPGFQVAKFFNLGLCEFLAF